MVSIKCPGCGTELYKGNRFCQSCGGKLTKDFIEKKLEEIQKIEKKDKNY